LIELELYPFGGDRAKTFWWGWSYNLKRQYILLVEPELQPVGGAWATTIWWSWNYFLLVEL
jgi:hypothetical protein